MIELKSSNVPKSVKSVRRQILLAGLMLLSSSSVLLLSGCSSAFKSGSSQPIGTVEVVGTKGVVHGGNQPVSGSTVTIYSVSAAGAGYGAAATVMGTPVTTNANGAWAYGAYTCGSASDELYVVSTGGNPGLGGTFANSALALTAALGPCGDIGSVPFVAISEVTTVATAYSLAGFMTNTTHVGTSPGNTVGLTNAFATFNNLADLGIGRALSVTPAYKTAPANTPPDTFRSIVPTDTINTLADILATCVNTGTSLGEGTSSACSSLFSLTGGATNTSDAALYIAHNPGLPTGGETNNISNLFNLFVPTGAPFQPVLSAAPNDFTLALNFTGGGLGGVNVKSRSGAEYLAIDGNGNIWLPNAYRQSVTELNNLGAPLSPSTTINSGNLQPLVLGGFQGGLLGPREVAIDQNGNAWISDDQNCLAAFNSSGAPLTNSPFTAVCGSSFGALGVSVDGNNQVWVAGNNFISSATDTGTLVSGFPVTSGFDTLTGFLGADYLGNTWYIDAGNGHFGALKNNGASYTASSSGPLSGPGNYAAFGTLAGDAGLTLWIPQGGAGTLNLQAVNATSASVNTVPTAFLPNTESAPYGIAADGGSNFYFTNAGGGTAPSGGTIPPNITAVRSSGSLFSPYTTGYTGGTTLTALGSPEGVAVDQSGNLWVVNVDNFNPPASGQLGSIKAGASNVTEFVGLAAPVNPVLAQDAKNSAYGTKP